MTAGIGSGRAEGWRGGLAGLAAFFAPVPRRPPPEAFRPADWRAHFDGIERGAILIDTHLAALHLWAPDSEAALVLPCALPADRSLARPGRTEVVRKVEGPGWRPSAAMLAREPGLPPRLPPGPGNPYGSHALHLAREGAPIHGGTDPGALGGRLRHGAFGLTDAAIARIFPLAMAGMPVRIV